MMQSELLQPSWPSFNNLNSSFDEDKDCIFDMDAYMGHSDFSIFSDEFIDFPVHFDELDVMIPKDDFSSDFEEIEAIFLSGEIGEMTRSLESEGTPFQLPIGGEDQWSLRQSSNSNETSMDATLSQPSLILPIGGEDQWSLSQSTNSSDTSMDATLGQPSLILPTDDMEIDNSLSLVHLIQAYGEAMEKDQTELAEVIMKCVGEKANPVGEIVERLLYYLFQPLDKQLDYLKQESAKNFHAAFKAFYQIFPYGKFAHFAANLAILEAIPCDVEIIHIVDFDMGEGIQWSSVIEAIGCQQREIRLTSIKWTGGDSNSDHTSGWRFDETKRQLLDHASSFGLKLMVEEMELNNLASEMKKMKKRGGRRQWWSFNCMVGIPHMGRVRSRRHVMEFLKLAKEVLSLQTPNCSSSTTKGIITFGDENGWEILKKSSSFGSFLDGSVVHYQALLESMESTFPIQFGDARTAMECLFVAPFVSSLSWIQRWHERKELCDFQTSNNGLEGWRVSKESLMEAKEMVREGVSPYTVVVEGDNNNEMALEWRGISLVRVSFWKN